MDSPQLENGYTKIANEIMDAFSNIRIAGEQMQCLMFILRKTYGYHKKEDSISLSQFAEATGLRKQHICRALNALRDRNIIVTKNGNRNITTYSFNKSYKKWLPKMVTPKPLPKMVKRVTKNGNSALPKLGHTKDIVTKDIITKHKKEIYKEKFEIFRKKYPGTKRGLDTEYDNFKKKNKNYKEIVDLLLPAIETQIEVHAEKIRQEAFCPEWKHLKTWINQKCWEEETVINEENDYSYIRVVNLPEKQEKR